MLKESQKLYFCQTKIYFCETEQTILTPFPPNSLLNYYLMHA